MVIYSNWALFYRFYTPKTAKLRFIQKEGFGTQPFRNSAAGAILAPFLITFFIVFSESGQEQKFFYK